jgi:hypothetical protein
MGLDNGSTFGRQLHSTSVAIFSICDQQPYPLGKKCRIETREKMGRMDLFHLQLLTRSHGSGPLAKWMALIKEDENTRKDNTWAYG